MILRTAALAACFLCACVQADQPTSPPNVITVFIDDMGWADLSCFGGKDVATSNIDRLADEGLRLTNFYVNSPICSPSRTALTTGHYPARHRITSYLARRELNTKRGMAQWLDRNAATLPRMFSASGYRTGHFGKWHMGGQRDVGEAPLVTEYGFDESLTNFEGLGPRVLPLCDSYDGSPLKRHDLGSEKLGRGPIEWENRTNITRRFVQQAIQFVDQSVADQKPFYINLWPDDVHSPFYPPEALRGDAAKRTLYQGVLKEMDNQLGQLFDRVREDPKLRDNTLIVLASDNGPEPGAGQSGPLRGFKGQLFEGGIRSPLIVWGPGLVESSAAGTVNETTIVSSIDVVASLVHLCRLFMPKGYACDGENLLDVLLGKSNAQRSQPLFWRRPPDRPGTHDEPFPDLAVRDGDWKLLCDVDGSNVQLYDLSQDISEQHDIATEHASIVNRLQAAVLTWNATLPVDGVGTADSPQKRGNNARGNKTRRKTGSLRPGKFVNPIAEGADPSIVRDGDRYLWCQSEGNVGISIWDSDRITSMGRKHVVWNAPASGPISKQVWAPELVKLDDRWYIYFAASDGDNANHLTYVLESKTADPLGDYELHGPLYTGDHFDSKAENIWAIDMIAMEHRGRRYAIWSGWSDPTNNLQYLYIAAMKSPTELAGPRVKICESDDYLWERTEETIGTRGLHEGPQPIWRGDRKFLVYSCGASWLPTYKLGMLELIGSDPLDPGSWKKLSKPVFQSTATTYGVGHGGFVQSPDDGQWWHVFHAKRDRRPGWRRVIHVQPMTWNDKGMPEFGRPIDAGKPLDLPSGAVTVANTRDFSWDLVDASSLDQLDYFGHHQLLRHSRRGIELGVTVDEPVNMYRSGEKLLVRDADFDDLEIEVTFSFESGDRDGGVLFRTTAASVGYDSQRGYFAGLVPRRGTVVLGKMDGQSWHHLADAEVDIDIDVDQPQTLRVRAVGDKMEVFVNGQPVPSISVRDSQFARGSVGIRVVDTHVQFHRLQSKSVSKNRDGARN